MPSALLKFWHIARFCLLASATPETQHDWHFAPVLDFVLSGLQPKPGLNPNPCYSLGRDEVVGSLRAQILKFLQCTKTFKGLMYLDHNQHTTLVVLCEGKAMMIMACKKEDSKL